jgi:hypothetical protein
MTLSNHLRVLTALISLVMITGGCQSEANNNGSSSATTASPEASSPRPAAKSAFVGLIRNISVYRVPNNQKDMAISMFVSLKNEGASSTARAWTLEVSGPGQALPSGLEAIHVNGIVDLPGGQSGKVDLDKEDLVLKSSRSPISQGNQIDGVLTFILPDTTEQQLSNRGVQLTVHFKDALGQAYQTPKAIVERGSVRRK